MSLARSSSLRSAIRSLVHELAERYPNELRVDQIADVERITFQIEQIYEPKAALADLGGGIGLFSPACSALGLETWLIDDFEDPVNEQISIDALDIHRQLGVRVKTTEIQSWGKSFGDETIDIVTCFESLEHWRHSPRPVFEEAFRILRPGGTLFLSAPNAVNVLKRLRVLIGRSNWSKFDDWYYSANFRGHVREPVLKELIQMSERIGFRVVRLWGRNWSLYRRKYPRIVCSVVDHMLRFKPSLCSNLYVLGVKPVSLVEGWQRQTFVQQRAGWRGRRTSSSGVLTK